MKIITISGVSVLFGVLLLGAFSERSSPASAVGASVDSGGRSSAAANIPQLKRSPCESVRIEQRSERPDETSTFIDETVCPGIVWTERCWVRPSVSGMISTLSIQEGQGVASAEPLAQIDNTSVELELERQRARVRQLQNVIREDAASLAIAQDECRRNEQLAGRNAVTAQSLVAARLIVSAREARLAATREELSTEESHVRLLEHRRSEYSILAPASGTVIEVHRQVNTYVMAGELLATIELPKKYVRLHLPVILQGRGSVEIQTYSGNRWFELCLARVKPGINDDDSQTCLLHVPEELSVQSGQILELHVRPREALR